MATAHAPAPAPAAAAPAAAGSSGALWTAILITIVAAAGNNIGKALQKQATRHLPRLAMRSDVVAQYLSSPAWLGGVAADLGGGLLMIAAFARAPVSIVQPVASMGLVFLMMFAHFYLKERLQPHEWVAAATAGFGVLLLGASSEPEGAPVAAVPPAAQPPAAAAVASAGAAAAAAAAKAATAAVTAPPPATAAAVGAAAAGAGAVIAPAPVPVTAAAAKVAAGAVGPSPLRVLCAFIVLLALLGAEVWWRQRRLRARWRRGAGGHLHGGRGGPAGADDAADAAACGLEAGACFGFSAAACRTGFQLAPSLGWLLVPVGLVASVGLTSSGFVIQTRGLKHGKAVVVCTLAAASSMVSGVAVGLLALGEPMPRSGPRRALRLLSWLLILAGVTQLSGAGDAGGDSGSGTGEGKAAGSGSSGLGVVQWLEDKVRSSHALPPGARSWLLRVLRVLDGGGKGPRKSGGGLLASNGKDDGGGPVLPVAMVPLQVAHGSSGQLHGDSLL